MSNTEVKQIDTLAEINHKLFRVIDKCTNKNATICDGCISKCSERITINNNVQEIYKLMRID